jgi:hypothetical protein
MTKRNVLLRSLQTMYHSYVCLETMSNLIVQLYTYDYTIITSYIQTSFMTVLILFPISSHFIPIIYFILLMYRSLLFYIFLSFYYSFSNSLWITTSPSLSALIRIYLTVELNKTIISKNSLYLSLLSFNALASCFCLWSTVLYSFKIYFALYPVNLMYSE